jgi:hypothetical protein
MSAQSNIFEQTVGQEDECSELVGSSTYVFDVSFSELIFGSAFEDARDCALIDARENEESDSSEDVLGKLGL